MKFQNQVQKYVPFIVFLKFLNFIWEDKIFLMNLVKINSIVNLVK